MELLLGVDVGTSGCKITVIDLAGRIIDEAFDEFQTSRPHAGWTEQDPGEWCRILCDLLRLMLSRGRWSAADIRALAVDGSTHNAVLVDDAGAVLRPAIMWTDQRSAPQAARLEAEAGAEIFRITYQRPSPTWTLPQMVWLGEHEPEVLDRTRRVFFTKDYVRWFLSGTWVTDHIEGQGSMFYDVERRTWSEELCRKAGLKPEWLPPLVEPATVVGAVSAPAAAATGLREGTPVIAGCPDSAVEDYAAGAIRPGQMILKLATAGNVNVMTGEPHPHPRTLTYSHVIPGMWYTVVATNTAASAQRWFRDLFCAEDTELAGQRQCGVYALLDERAATVPAGSEGLFFHPYLLGERAPYWDPNLRGSFVGATMRHTKAHFLRALLEGVIYSLRDCFRTVESLGLPADEIRLIGGGAKSALWTQIAADVFARPIVRTEGCDASFGSALLAGVGAGIFTSPADAVRRCTRVRDTFTPNPDAAAVYARFFPLYCRIHDDLAQTYAAISQALNPNEG